MTGAADVSETSRKAPLSSQRIGLTTATSIAVANMVGTGVFTSLGFQLLDIQSGFALLSLWVVGGIFALCGALTYGELAAALPRSGGEFHFLGRIFHPCLGFLAGWVSFIMGFALPVALAAMAFGSYLEAVAPLVEPKVSASILVAIVTLAHLRDLRLGSAFQNLFTGFKLLLVVIFIGASAWAALGREIVTEVSFVPSRADVDAILSAPYWVSLLYVMFAYAGWNASVYVIDEMRRPERNVPRSLALATGLVLVLYTLLNWSFLVTAPVSEMAGQIDVGHVSARYIWGESGGRLMSGLLCLALVSTISAMVWAGPRVTQVIGQDYVFFRKLARTNSHGVPVVAILTQSLLVIAMILFTEFQQLLIYTQFILALSSAATVAGVFWLRHREPDLPRPYRTWGYPYTPLLFLLVTLLTVGFTLLQNPVESTVGLATVLLGLPIYLASPRTTPAESGATRP
ncbi:MAG: amino acid permease [Thermoanaerobaculia bacterium]|nr:amino acid permease [Thermoanaerobaculia bacterium]